MSSEIVLNPVLVNKIQTYMNDPVYRETIEAAAQYNARLGSERAMRLPFLDSQTGVAQNHSNLFMDSRQRLPGLKEGQIYTYPSKRWMKKRRQYLSNFMQPRLHLRKETGDERETIPVPVSDPTIPAIPVIISSGGPGPSGVPEETKEIIERTKEEIKPPQEWYYDELEMPDAGEFEEPDPDSDYDYEESYSNKRKKKKITPKAPRQQNKNKRKITYDPITDAEKPFACDLCGARYKTRPGLTYHYTHSHKEKEDEEEDEMIPASPKRDEARRRGGGGMPPPILHPQQPLGGGLQPPTLQPQQPLPPSLPHHMQPGMQQNPSGPGGGMMGPPPQMMGHHGGQQHHPLPPHLIPQQQPHPHSQMPPHIPMHGGQMSMYNHGGPPGPPGHPPPGGIFMPPHPGHPQQQHHHPQQMPPRSMTSSSGVPPHLPMPSIGVIGGPGLGPGPTSGQSSIGGPSTSVSEDPNAPKKPEDGKRGVQPSSYCDFCLGDAGENKKSGGPEELVSCSDCGRSGHPTCLQFTANMIISVKKYRWQCIECKCCSICGGNENDDQLLFCDDCDRGYHMYCLSPPLEAPPEGSWSCTLCLAEFHKK